MPARASFHQEVPTVVPFVGCKSVREAESLEVPKEFYAEPYRGRRVIVHLPGQTAQRLAYYKSEQSFGVLAPRGWHCFCLFGSRGSTLYVSPLAVDTVQVLSPISTAITGPAVEIDRAYGGTSGRYEVARVIARVFPKRRSFVDNLIEGKRKEGIESASGFPFGPYPNDKLTYRNANIVEFETPANMEGLGTQSTLKKNSDPIRGVAILLGKTPDLVQLSVRLPPQSRDLSAMIIHQVEANAAHTGSHQN